MLVVVTHTTINEALVILNLGEGLGLGEGVTGEGMTEDAAAIMVVCSMVY